MLINHWFLFILFSLVLIWKLDFFSTLLNLKALNPEVPERFRDVFDQEKYEESQSYTRDKAVFSIVSGTISLIALIAFWWFNGFSWLDESVRAFQKGPILTGLLFVGVLIIGQTLISLPLDLYNTFILEGKYGFNKTTPATYLADLIKGTFLTILFGVPILSGLLWIFETVPTAWLWGWIFTTVVSLFITYMAPTWIMPLFNKFDPLPEGPLKEEIHVMAEKCKFPLKEVSIMDGSKRSEKSNAFFSGFGENKRIALFDTLIAKHNVAELVGVLAHEIGHYKKKHIVKSMILGIGTTGVFFFLLGLILHNRSLFDAFGVKETSVYVSLVLFAILMSPLNTILSVGGNILSRKHEFEADAYAVAMTEDPDAMSDALKKLSSDNLSNLTPHPFYVFLNYSHPPVLERIEAIKNSKP